MARAAGRVHPKDWIEVYESHTPYEWLVQRMLAVVDPWGDERDDLRAALNTLATIPGAANHNEVMSALVGYLKINEVKDTVGPAQIRAALES